MYPPKRMLRTALLLASAALCPHLPARGAEPAGIEEILPSCLSCHGELGISSMPGVPSLAGQPDGFLQWQMVYFRSKNRKSDVMEPLAASVFPRPGRSITHHRSAAIAKLTAGPAMVIRNSWLGSRGIRSNSAMPPIGIRSIRLTWTPNRMAVSECPS